MLETIWRLYEAANAKAHRDYLDRRLAEFERCDPWGFTGRGREHGPDSETHRCDRPECFEQNRAYHHARDEKRRKARLAQRRLAS
jgi:hypothetical protein